MDGQTTDDAVIPLDQRTHAVGDGSTNGNDLVVAQYRTSTAGRMVDDDRSPYEDAVTVRALFDAAPDVLRAA